jgi:hypothetical protein
VRREPLAETVEMMVGRWEKVGRVVRRVRRKVVIRRWAWHVWVLGVGRRGTTVCRRSEHHLRVGRSHVRGRGPVKPHSVLHHHLMMVVGVRGSGREMGRRVRQLLGQLGCQQQRFQSPSGATRLLLGLPCSFAVALIAAGGGASLHGNRLCGKQTCLHRWPLLKSSRWLVLESCKHSESERSEILWFSSLAQPVDMS